MTDHRLSSTDNAKVEAESIAIAEETLSVSKARVATGKVRVTTSVETFEERAVIDLDRQDVEVTRVAFGHVIESCPEIRTEGDVTIVPILEEILVIEKRLVLKEELHIRRGSTTETVDTPVTLRRQHAVIEHVDQAGHALKDRTDNEHD